MGRITKGILGGFSGKVGTVIGSNWKGIDYMRSRPGKRQGPSSPAQEAQREKFGLVAKFLQPLSPLTAYTFKSFATRMTGGNSALSYNLKNAVAGTVSPFAINYPQVLISRGDLPNAGSPTASKNGSNVKFTWTDNSGMGKASGIDKTIVVVYCPAMEMFIYADGNSLRQDREEELDTSTFAGQEVQTWIGFISDDNKDCASSIFTGAVSL